jgi:hypothetical protein
MASVNQTRPHRVNQMGKTHSKPLAARHDRGMAWARHGNGMLCVNRHLMGCETEMAIDGRHVGMYIRSYTCIFLRSSFNSESSYCPGGF